MTRSEARSRRLDVELRTAAGGEDSDTLRLASWFTSSEHSVARRSRAQRSRPAQGVQRSARSCSGRRQRSSTSDSASSSSSTSGLTSPSDVDGFNSALGFDDDGWVPYDDPDGAENFQILSPVRMRPHGVLELNRRIQRRYRAAEIDQAMNAWATSLGDEGIVLRDKVIQLRNGKRRGFDGRSATEEYLANGEVGLVARDKNEWLDVAFAGRPNLRFGYRGREFPSAALGRSQLAYALTVHKAQGVRLRQGVRRACRSGPGCCRASSSTRHSRVHATSSFFSSRARTSSGSTTTRVPSDPRPSGGTRISSRRSFACRSDDVPYAEGLDPSDPQGTHGSQQVRARHRERALRARASATSTSTSV